MTYYADILEECDGCLYPLLLDVTGGSSIEKATEKMHKIIKDAVMKKFGVKEA